MCSSGTSTRLEVIDNAICEGGIFGRGFRLSASGFKVRNNSSASSVFSYFRPYGSIFSRSYTFIIILVCRNKKTQGPYLAVPQGVVYLSALN